MLFIFTFIFQVLGEILGFYNEFFNNLMDGLCSQDDISLKDAGIVIKSYMECVLFLIVKNIDNKELTQYLLQDQVYNHIYYLWQKNFLQPNQS